MPAVGARSGPAYPDGFTGTLALQSAESLSEEQTGAVLSRMSHLIRWAQAQQTKMLFRMQDIYRDGFLQDTGKLNPGLAFSLAAEEAAAILHLPTGTAKMLMAEAGVLCGTHTSTLHELEAGRISYGHAQAVVDQSQGVPVAELPGFEADLLAGAAGQTAAQFRVRSRRLRENRYPETTTVRHRTAFERRRVCVEPESDGMSWLSVFLSAPRAQVIYTQLSTAARGEQTAGDPRPVDQLRADILTDLLLPDGGLPPSAGTGPNSAEPNSAGCDSIERGASDGRARARTEIMVLINAETLFGADDQPAELHGYGPVSSETARRLAREAAHWTPVEQNPETQEILRVGRRRKVPAGMKRWLRARDGTCRFPGCRSNALLSEIDHTKPWAQGGVTDHDNLEHLCRRHHMFKTAGFWKARQPSPGIIEWTSPGGRTYRTEPHLSLSGMPAGPCAGRTGKDVGCRPSPGTSVQPREFVWPSDPVWSSDPGPGDYGADPPPF